MAKTKLTLVNHSNDANNSPIVIFQKNIVPGFDDLAVAWRVVENLGLGDSHAFECPLEFGVGCADSWGNHTPTLLACSGQSFHMVESSSGNILELSGHSQRPTEVEIRNDLRQGAISANIYKDNKLLATKMNIAPGQKAVFEFKPIIYIGVFESQITEGQIMNSAMIESIKTELSLERIVSADILMTGRGPASFNFELGNVVKV